MTARVLITGVGGQDGSHLADLCVEAGREVHGLAPWFDRLHNVAHLAGKVTVHRGDVTDASCLFRVLAASRPDEVYHTADIDSTHWGACAPLQAWDVTATAALSLLEACRQVCPEARVFLPLSATVFGCAAAPQDEGTPFDPRSVYACAKAAVYHACRHYRRAFGMHVSAAILYGHDGPRRGPGYLLGRLVAGALAVAAGRAETLTVGDPDAVVDVGSARHYMAAARRIVALPAASEFVLASGVGHTARDLAVKTLRLAGVPGGEGRLRSLVAADPAFVVPAPRPTLIGDPSRAKEAFGFRPRPDPEPLIAELIEHARRRQQGDVSCST